MIRHLTPALLAVMLLATSQAQAFTDSSWGVDGHFGIAGLWNDTDESPVFGGADVNYRWATVARLRLGDEFGFALGASAGVDFGPGVTYGQAGADLWLILGFIELRIHGGSGWLDQTADSTFPDLDFPWIFNTKIEAHLWIGSWRVLAGFMLWDNAGLGDTNPGARLVYLGVGLRLY